MEKQPLLDKPNPSPRWSCLPFCLNKQPVNDEYLDISDSDDDSDDDLMDLPYPPQITSTTPMGDRLTQLRRLMLHHGIAVYIIPSEDEHQSEFTALADKRRDFISGFTGSAGVAVVTLDDGELLTGEAALSTDGRYFLQAQKQLDPRYWRLLKQGQIGHPLWQEFALDKASKSKVSSTLSCDPSLISLSVGQLFSSTSRYRGVTFRPLSGKNLVDEIWADEKPPRSLSPVYHYDLNYSGEDTNSKLTRVRQSLNHLDASHLIITALDDIGWLFNLRCDDDIPFSPFFFSYAIVTQDLTTLYINRKKLVNVDAYLSTIGNLHIRDYDAFYSDLASIKATTACPNIRVVFPEKASCNYALLSSLPQSVSKQTIIYDSIVATLKLFKNETELFNARIAQYKDSLAFIILASWLDHKLAVQKHKVSEYEAAQKIYAIRSRLPNFKGLSYETISSSGANAAIIHYAPTKEENSPIDPKKPYLLDSGSHYLEGTTDITRTFKFGYDGLSPQLKKLYTLVLKGHLAVATAKFPAGSTATGTILDSYARRPLWNEGLDFNHGTGHGVGSFGNVHEGPLYILTTAGGNSSRDYFKKGAILTDEPGYYVDGDFGFRVESELEIVDAEKGKAKNGEKFLAFAYLTKVPFCAKLIETSILSPSEKAWINGYHHDIRTDFGPKLLKMGEKRAYAWLMRETAPLR